MSRAGREPAEDVKRRSASACKSAGLKVATARMYLRKNRRDRVILVAASPPDWACSRSMVTILTTVGMAGDWSRMVDIRCSTAQNDSIMKFWEIPVMQGRSAVPVQELVAQLRETLREREQVLAAMRLGVDGPYTFKRSHWAKPYDLLYA